MNILWIVCSIKHWKSQCGKMQTQICCFYYVNIRLKCHNFALIQNISSLLWYDNTSFSKYLLSSFLFFWTYQKTFFISRLGASLETQGQSVGSRQKVGQSFSSTGERAPGYWISPSYFQTFKWMPAPDWAQKMLCIIVPNWRTFSPEFFL